MAGLLERQAFATAESTRRRPGESDIAHADRTYRPSFPGVHLCGADHEEDRFFTILDWPTADAGEARRLWEALRAECDAGDEGDFVVDLNDGDSHVDDFWCNRQMLPRLHDLLRSTTEKATAPKPDQNREREG